MCYAKRKWTNTVQNSRAQMMSQMGINMTTFRECNVKNLLAKARNSHSTSEDAVEIRNRSRVIKAKCLSSATQGAYDKRESTPEYKEKQSSKIRKCSVSFAYPLEKSPVVTLHSCASLEKFIRHADYDLSSSSVCQEFKTLSENLFMQKNKDDFCDDRTRESVDMRPLLAQTAGNSTTADKPDFEGNTERKCKSINRSSRLCSEKKLNKHSSKLNYNSGKKSIKQTVDLYETAEKSVVMGAVSEKGEKHKMELPGKDRQPNKHRKGKCSKTLNDQTNPPEFTAEKLDTHGRICATSIEHDTLMPQNTEQEVHSSLSNIEVQMKFLNEDTFEKLPDWVEAKKQRKSMIGSRPLKSERKKTFKYVETMKDQTDDSVRDQEMKRASKCLKSKKEFHMIGCQRIVPMIGKNEWKSRSCARTSQWSFPKCSGFILHKKSCSPVCFQDPIEEVQGPDLALIPVKIDDSMCRKRKLESMVVALPSDGFENGTFCEVKQVKPAVDQVESEHTTVQKIVCVPEDTLISNILSENSTIQNTICALEGTFISNIMSEHSTVQNVVCVPEVTPLTNMSEHSTLLNAVCVPEATSLTNMMSEHSTVQNAVSIPEVTPLTNMMSEHSTVQNVCVPEVTPLTNMMSEHSTVQNAVCVPEVTLLTNMLSEHSMVQNIVCVPEVTPLTNMMSEHSTVRNAVCVPEVTPLTNMMSEHSTIQNAFCVPEVISLTNMSIRSIDNCEYNKSSIFGEANKSLDQQTVKCTSNCLKKKNSKNIGDFDKLVVKDKLVVPELDKILNAVELPNFKIPMHKNSEPRTFQNSRNLDHGSHSVVDLQESLSAAVELQSNTDEQYSSGLNSSSQFCNVDSTSLQASVDQSYHESSRNFRIPVYKNSKQRTLPNSRNLDHGTHSVVDRHENMSVKVEIQSSKEKQYSESNSSSTLCNAKTYNVDIVSVRDSTDQSCHENFRRTVLHNHSNQVEFIPVKPKFASCERETKPSASKDIAASIGFSGQQEGQQESLQPLSSGDTHSYGSSCDIGSGKKKNKIYVNDFKAYEEDVLVLDVIQDDPDLFGSPCDESKSQADSADFQKASVIKHIHGENGLLPKLHELKQEASNFGKCSPKLPACHRGGADFNRYCYGSFVTGNQMKRQNSPLGSIGGHTEESLEDGQLTESEDCKSNFEMVVEDKFPEKTIALKDEKGNVCENRKRENSKYLGLLSNNLVDSKMPLPSLKGQPDDCKLPLPWKHDFKFTNKPSEHLPLQNLNFNEAWKMENNSLESPHPSYLPMLKTPLPSGYCNYYFNTLRSCTRRNCWFFHVPKQGDEKFCMEMIQKMVNTNHISLLQRAVQIFTNYYRTIPPGIHYDAEVQRDLLLSLLDHRLLPAIFLVLNIGVIVKILPSVEVLVKVLDHVATTGFRKTVPCLVDIICKLVEAGMILLPQHLDYIIKLLNEMQASESEIGIILAMKTRFLAKESKKNSICDLDLAVAEIEHCKERADWRKLGTLYVNIRMNCQSLTDFKRFSTCVTDALTKDSKDERSVIPFCEFSETVNQDPNYNGIDKNLLGRIGISVIYSYHKSKQWIKGKKVLDKLHKMQIDFTILRGLTGSESLAPRCQVVNVAVEIFLENGSLDGAIWVLKESEWIINTSLWPCDRMDVLNRHNLLCTIAQETLTKSLYRQAFEVLQNLPGLQEPQDALDVSQYGALFNQLLNSCIENNSLGMSSSVVDFVISKNIPVKFSYLRGLITAMGRSCLWLKARSHYKSALSLGIYPPLEGNLYRKILQIPSYMSEIEMLLAIEIFMVSNASNIQSPGGSSQTFQIILKRCVEDKLQSKDDYRTAVERLRLAVRLSTPKLLIKYMTINIAMEQVYILDHSAALKWLKENMKWAGKVWLFQNIHMIVTTNQWLGCFRNVNSTNRRANMKMLYGITVCSHLWDYNTAGFFSFRLVLIPKKKKKKPPLTNSY
uniref:Protein TOPAZ1 n=1 Tax=Geotrypetes seraphini TaxID=260995 RepID=A0A6P8PV12_GEOSA|nr:protein TOPAZ1 isoform X2 [Geotrypetes seraphini]